MIILKFMQISLETSDQDGGVSKCVSCILPQPRQNNNQSTEQPSFRTAWNLAEWKSGK